jgi:hypothetical protein
MKLFNLILIIIMYMNTSLLPQVVSQWRGPDRNGIFPESGLLKSWPEEGPELLWSIDDLDKGYASVSVSDRRIYITGLEASTEYLTALDLSGNRL